jgi:hypothetical protein
MSGEGIVILSKEINASCHKGTSVHTASLLSRLLQDVGGVLKLVGMAVVPLVRRHPMTIRHQTGHCRPATGYRM